MNKKLIFYPLFLMLITFFLPFMTSISFSADEIENSAIETLNLSPPPDEVLTEKTITVFNADTKETEEQILEEYLIGVVSAEMPASYEKEALKAQAVAARTYILNKENRKNPDHSNAIVCTSPNHCKGYISPPDAEKKWGKNWVENFYPKIKEAVLETRGEYITYNGEIIEAYFFALSNGKTESSLDVWGSSRPYLMSTESSFDTQAPNFLSTASFSLLDFNSRLKTLNPDFSPSSSPTISDTVLTDGKRVSFLKINGTKFQGTDIRSLFSLKSTDFSIKTDGDNVIFLVKGNGHGVGMSQYGANCLAKEGKNYREILSHYYKGIEILTK